MPSEMFAQLLDWVVGMVKPHPPPALGTMRRGPPERKENPLMIQFFTWESKHPEMSWWKHFQTEVPRLAEMGITQVWLPPPNKAMKKTGQGYDAYDLWDLGEFNQKGTIATRWGTKKELQEAIVTANAHGIDVLIDAVLNHKLGADRMEKFSAVQVDEKNRMKEIGPVKEIEGWTMFDFNGRNGKYSQLKWTHEHFSGVDWDNRSRTKGVFRIVSKRHTGWSPFVDKENGNYDYLLGIDIDHRHSDVQKDLLTWATWILDTTGAMGFRLDAIKHMDRRFLLAFLKEARKLKGKENLFAVAEYWSANINLLLPYIKMFEGLVTFFDVPLHHKFHEASKAGSNYDLRTLLKDTVAQKRPGDAVTFVDNHDTQIGQSLESWVYSQFKLQAYSFILLRNEGQPCVFYGDLYPNDECYDASIVPALKRIILARKRFAYGAQFDYLHEKNCIGWVREGTDSMESSSCAVVLSNAGLGTEPTVSKNSASRSHEPLLEERVEKVQVHTVRMKVGRRNAGKAYRPFLHDTDPAQKVEVDSAGWGAFTCPFGQLEVWVPAESSV